MWWRWWSMALIFLATHFPQKQLLPSEVSFHYNINFILAYFGDRLCRHFVFHCILLLLLHTYRIYDRRNFQFFTWALNLFACKRAKYGDPMYDTHLISRTRFSLNSPSLNKKSNNMLQSLTLTLVKNGCKLCNFKEIKNILAPHAHITKTFFHSSALLLTAFAATASLVV